MNLSAKSFLSGAGIGVASPLLLLQAWGSYLDKSIIKAAQPRLVTPLRRTHWDGGL